MNWKKWPYWVRGGVVGVLFAVFLVGGFHYCPSVGVDGKTNFQCLLWAIPLSIGEFIFYGLFDFPLPLFLFVEIIIWFILFALLGWLYGKIKNRKKI